MVEGVGGIWGLFVRGRQERGSEKCVEWSTPTHWGRLICHHYSQLMIPALHDLRPTLATHITLLLLLFLVLTVCTTDRSAPQFDACRLKNTGCWNCNAQNHVEPVLVQSMLYLHLLFGTMYHFTTEQIWLLLLSFWHCVTTVTLDHFYSIKGDEYFTSNIYW